MEILTVVDGIIHCIYATFHVDLMYDSELMNQKVSRFAIFLIFWHKMSNIFVKIQDSTHLKILACSCKCLLSYETYILLIRYTIVQKFTQMCQNSAYFKNKFHTKSPIIFVKIQDITHLKILACSCRCLLSFETYIWLIRCTIVQN